MATSEHQIDPTVTFVIPVRHPENAKNWQSLTRRLSDTAQSIAAQTHASWRAIVVGNEGAVFPDLPDGFDIVRVDFPPNPQHEMGAAALDAVYEAFRLDKGRRVLAGMLAAGNTGYFMIVDDDDFVSRQIVAHARENCGAPGWSIAKGYVWSEGGHLALLHPQFATICGTSHIIRADLYDLQASFEAANGDYIKTMLGSHVKIESILADRGAPLEPLPFAGAVYRVGHAEAHSKSKGIVQTYVFDQSRISRRVALGNLSRFRLVTPGFAASFGMGAARPGR